jgi:hypothetical protein
MNIDLTAPATAIGALMGSTIVWQLTRMTRRHRPTTKRRAPRRRIRRTRDATDIRTAVEWVTHHDPRSIVDTQAYQRLYDANTIRPHVRHALETAWTRKTFRALSTERAAHATGDLTPYIDYLDRHPTRRPYRYPEEN